ncbi:hypothetical protein V6N11_075297 [Hibiscus sabdariffa]|uniref:Uncharacterized protein n=1 Tax=Hibiscus sabdariffa TaxID=183260 RepID=A0ABR2R648_9ROSI
MALFAMEMATRWRTGDAQDTSKGLSDKQHGAKDNLLQLHFSGGRQQSKVELVKCGCCGLWVNRGVHANLHY